MDSPSRSSTVELYEIVRKIPAGYVVNYAALGRILPKPVSGYIVGRWMALCPPDCPWWRVVAKDGSLPTNKRDPEIARKQRQLLADEGVGFLDDRVNMKEHYWVEVEFL